jgi:hypothetical protein
MRPWIPSFIPVSILTILIGLFLKVPHVLLVIPLSVFIAQLINLWISSNWQGSTLAVNPSRNYFSKAVRAWIFLGQLTCFGLILWWFLALK